MNKIITLLIIIAATSFIFPQTGKISGNVLDENKQPVIGANVIIQGTTLGASVGLDGSYYILNIPSGVYILKISAVGYTTNKIENVEVRPGLTTRINVELTTSSVNLKEIVIISKKPPIQKDLTSKMQGFDSHDLQSLPLAGSITNALTSQAGITTNIVTTPVNSQPVFGQFATTPNDGLHFRGGRSNETLYSFDGINVTDALWGGYNLDVIGVNTLQSIETLTGTFGPKYGEAMSGVVLMETADNVPDKMQIKLTSYSDGFGKISGSQNTYDFDGSINTPLFGLKNFGLFVSGKDYSSDGYIYGYIPPNYVDSRGSDISGTPIKVPMGFKDNRSLFAKVIWQISAPFKLRIGYLNTKTQQGFYNQYYKHDPYGTPNDFLDGNLEYIKLTHVVSNSTFYNLTVSRYQRKFKSDVFDSPAEYAIRPEISGAEFAVAGENYVYFNSNFVRLEFKGDLSSQITKQQNITLGFSLDQMKTTFNRSNPNGGFYAIEDYDLNPYQYSGYANDKMEFDDIGMVINIGGRFDYINPNRNYILDITQPNGAIGKVKPVYYFSPRFGISYPISDVAAFRFGYGYYYQYPAFYEVYQGMNREYSGYPAPDVGNVLGAVAKGDLKPEKTINYEAGVQIALDPALHLDVTGFYRKTSNLIGEEVISGYVFSGTTVKQQNYPVFSNVDYATVKGIEISLNKRFSNYFSGFLNYTYSQALVSSSLIFSQPQDIARTFPADWDQPHTLSFGTVFQFPSKWGFSILGSVSSGTPYTYNVFQPNALRAPFLSDIDLMAYKELDIYKVKARIFIQITNLLNRRNIYWVYADSGVPGQGADPGHSHDYYDDPTQYGPDRNFQFGISFNY